MKTLGYKGIRVLHQKSNKNIEIKGPWRKTIPPMKDRETISYIKGTSNGEDLSTPYFAKEFTKQLAFCPAWTNSTSICVDGLIL